MRQLLMLVQNSTEKSDQPSFCVSIYSPNIKNNAMKRRRKDRERDGETENVNEDEVEVKKKKKKQNTEI